MKLHEHQRISKSWNDRLRSAKAEVVLELNRLGGEASAIEKELSDNLVPKCFLGLVDVDAVAAAKGRLREVREAIQDLTIVNRRLPKLEKGSLAYCGFVRQAENAVEEIQALKENEAPQDEIQDKEALLAFRIERCDGAARQWAEWLPAES